MAFEGLSSRLQSVFTRLRGRGKLTEDDVKEAMREIRLALLDADVNFKVVKDFVATVRERCVGQEVLQSLTPGQQVVKIVHDELTSLMGREQSKLAHESKPPTIVMMAGLQGAGKTTASAKLALSLAKQHRRPLLVACDVYRPAAIKQLQVLGEQVKVPVFSMGDQVSPVDIAKGALEHARTHGNDYVIIDTAGRLHIDDVKMSELQAIVDAVQPQEILLVIDALTGQDAVQVAEAFHKDLQLSGVILTRMDSDARGGAALSVRAVTGCPIKFVGTGEKMEPLEPFHPERMASRILGMGDVLTLIERAQEAVDQEKAAEMEKKLRKAEFTLEDFVDQITQVRKLGSMEQILGMIPGMGKLGDLKNAQIDERQLDRVIAIVRSMTVAEKRDPRMIDASRRKRIAKGSGTAVQDVNRLLRQFEDMQKMFKQFSGMMQRPGKRGKRGLAGLPSGIPDLNPGGKRGPRFPFR